jgi:AcrR family transcriptional regulator
MCDKSYLVSIQCFFMTSTDPVSTRNKILDQAERVYATSGLTYLTVRALTDDAGVNLAAVNYHFRSKAALIEAMLMRRIMPLWEERTQLLARIKTAYGPHIQPLHLFSVVLMPWIKLTSKPESAHLAAFLLRATSDTDNTIRGTLAKTFGVQGDLLDQAFVDAMPELGRQDVLWRVRLFFNAQPGSIVNHNVGVMCVSLFERSGMTVIDALTQFAFLAESAFNGSANACHVRYLIDNLWETLANTQSVEK